MVPGHHFDHGTSGRRKGGITPRRPEDGRNTEARAGPIYRLLKASENRQAETENQRGARVAEW
jgi:hypothetical protein